MNSLLVRFVVRRASSSVTLILSSDLALLHLRTRASAARALRRRSAIVMPSCFSAAWNCSSSSRLFCFLMFSTMLLNCSSPSAKPSSRPRWTSSSSSTAFEDQLRRHLGDRALQLGALRRDVRQLGPVTQDRRSAAARTRVLVRMSPFTLTRTCSMISARSGTAASRATQDTDDGQTSRFSMDNSLRNQYFNARGTVRSALEPGRTSRPRLAGPVRAAAGSPPS